MNQNREPTYEARITLQVKQGVKVDRGVNFNLDKVLKNILKNKGISAYDIDFENGLNPTKNAISVKLRTYGDKILTEEESQEILKSNRFKKIIKNNSVIDYKLLKEPEKKEQQKETTNTDTNTATIDSLTKQIMKLQQQNQDLTANLATATEEIEVLTELNAEYDSLSELRKTTALNPEIIKYVQENGTKLPTLVELYEKALNTKFEGKNEQQIEQEYKTKLEKTTKKYLQAMSKDEKVRVEAQNLTKRIYSQIQQGEPIDFETEMKRNNIERRKLITTQKLDALREEQKIIKTQYQKIIQIQTEYLELHEGITNAIKILKEYTKK